MEGGCGRSELALVGIFCAQALSWGQDAGSELGIALGDDGYGEGDALVEGLAGDSMGADHVAEFVLWVTLGGWGDSFV
jgi:hypothetical protein